MSVFFTCMRGLWYFAWVSWCVCQSSPLRGWVGWSRCNWTSIKNLAFWIHSNLFQWLFLGLGWDTRRELIVSLKTRVKLRVKWTTNVMSFELTRWKLNFVSKNNGESRVRCMCVRYAEERSTTNTRCIFKHVYIESGTSGQIEKYLRFLQVPLAGTTRHRKTKNLSILAPIINSQNRIKSWGGD